MNPQAPSFGFDSAPQEQSPAPCDDVTGPDALLSPMSPSKTPPPLPEKKRHIHEYLQFCSSYSAQSAASFYQRPLTSSQRYSNRQREVETAYQLTHLETHLETHLDTNTQDSAPSPELPAPVLPPKKRLQDPAESDDQNEETQRRDSSQGLQQEAEPGRRSREQQDEQQEQEEVLLTNHKEILHRITMKPEEEEGPDVKAASPDILLVYATETDKSPGESSPPLSCGRDLFFLCEIFTANIHICFRIRKRSRASVAHTKTHVDQMISGSGVQD
ncbi:rap guanine nucleotide exchange factor 1-like [Micropterus salmoides]|uniref:rap guanine nucleotide exchange factor 1-like n=1 Tax=Micropterus salmoides TaxID=27706 RepID=UPI0018EBE64F|nr:rap guanine nucleotide exchange factor 1-like [Micropterus salmoides]